MIVRNAMALAAMALVLFVAPAHADTTRSCDSLVGLDLSKVADKPAHVVSAKEEQFLSRAVCQVSGVVEPQVRFRLRLPIEGWDGRYLQTGCSALCGRITGEVAQVHGCAPFEKVEMAVATTDMGHQGPAPDFGDDPQLRVDFAHRGVHVTAEVAKVRGRALVAHVGRRDGHLDLLERRAAVDLRDLAGDPPAQAAATGLQITAVPSLDGQP